MRLGRKFSHKTFWPEVYESGATRLQYVGELCRYLVNAPVHPLEKKHKLREVRTFSPQRTEVVEAS